MVMANLDPIFAVWPSAKAMADEIGVSDVTVRQWRNRSGTIPTKYWRQIRGAAAVRGVELSIEMFVPSETDAVVDGPAGRAA